MALLLHSATLADIKKNSNLYNNGYTTEAKRSIIFTEDGYIVGRGKEYYVGVTGADRGLSVIDNKVGHARSITDNLKLGDVLNNYTVTTTNGIFDSYGHLKSTDSTTFNINKITDIASEANKTYYLLGGNSSGLYNPAKSTGLYITTNTNNVPTLYVLGNIYAGGSAASNRVLTTGELGNLTGALRYKGNTGDTNSGWANNGVGPISHTVGDVWYVSVAGKYASQDCEVGDMLICRQSSSRDATAGQASHWTVVQNNWTAAAVNSQLSWGTLVTLATIGGKDIKAQLPSTPVTSFNGATGALTSTITANIASTAASAYSIGSITLPGKSAVTLYGVNTTHNFYVGKTGANANAASVTTGTDIYLTTKLTTAASDAIGTNILGFHAGTGIHISSADKLITISNSGVTSFNGSTGALTSSVTASKKASDSGAYKIGTITLPGAAAVDLYGVNTDTNTWRNIEVYKIVSGAEDGTRDTLYNTSIGTNALKFSKTFSVNSSEEIDLVWAEVDSQGNISYVV